MWSIRSTGERCVTREQTLGQLPMNRSGPDDDRALALPRPLIHQSRLDGRAPRTLDNLTLCSRNLSARDSFHVRRVPIFPEATVPIPAFGSSPGNGAKSNFASPTTPLALDDEGFETIGQTVEHAAGAIDGMKDILERLQDSVAEATEQRRNDIEIGQLFTRAQEYVERPRSTRVRSLRRRSLVMPSSRLCRSSRPRRRGEPARQEGRRSVPLRRQPWPHSKRQSESSPA